MRAVRLVALPLTQTRIDALVSRARYAIRSNPAGARLRAPGLDCCRAGGAGGPRGGPMKPKACVVVASEMTVRAFLGPQLRAMQDHYDVTVVVNSQASDLLRDLGVTGTVTRCRDRRGRSRSQADVRALLALVRLMRRQRFDLVHSMTPKAGLLAMVAARLSKIPVRLHTFTGQVWATRTGLLPSDSQARRPNHRPVRHLHARRQPVAAGIPDSRADRRAGSDRGPGQRIGQRGRRHTIPTRCGSPPPGPRTVPYSGCERRAALRRAVEP